MTKERGMDDFEEKEVMGGVYITDYRTQTATINPHQSDDILRKLAPHEVIERQNQVTHLLRSNNELREADPDCEDEEIQLAIKENEQIIIRYKLEILKAQEEA